MENKGVKENSIIEDITYDFTINPKWLIKINKPDEKFLLCIKVRGAGPGNMKRTDFVVFNHNGRVTKYLINDIKYFKNKNFKAELLFVKWIN